MQTVVDTKQVIVVETNEKDAQESARALAGVDGVQIALLTPSPDYALEKAKEVGATLVVIDEKVQGISDFCQKLKQESPNTILVVTTLNTTPELEQKAKGWGAKAILPKPLHEVQQELPALFEPPKPAFEWNGLRGYEDQAGQQTVFPNIGQLEMLQPEYQRELQSPFHQKEEQSILPNGPHGYRPQSTEGKLSQGSYPVSPQQGAYGQGVFGQGFQSVQPPRPKMVITVYSPKGGVGKTTVALNLAVALRKVSAQYLGEQQAFNVGLADFDVDFGDVAASLQLVPRGSVVDWPKEENFDFEYVKNLFTYHTPSNVAILAGPERPEMEFMLDQQQATRVIDGMHKIFDIVVVDMGYSLRKSSLMAMSRSTHPLFITTPDTPAVRDMTRAKRSLEEHNINFAKAGLIINKIPRKGRPPLSVQEVKRYIGIPVVAEIPEDPTVLEALSEGTPLALKSKSPAGEELEALAYQTLKDYLPQEEKPKKIGGFWGRLFGRG